MLCMERAARRIWSPMLCLSWLVLATPVPQAMAGCLEDTRPVQVGEHVARLRSFLCTPDDGPSSAPLVRVEFHRLSDTAAGTLIAGQFQVLKETLGHTVMAENEVHAIFRELVQRFRVDMREGNLSLSIETPRGGVGANFESEDKVNNRVYGIGGSANLRSITSASELFANGWNHHCQKSDTRPGFYLTWWRYARESDFQGYENGNPYEDGGVNLGKFLISQGCPKSSFIVSARSGECGADLATLTLSGATVIFDFALIDNIGQNQIEIGGVHGKRIGKPYCRIASNSHDVDKTDITNLLRQKLKLLPRQRVLIPLKVSFSSRSWMDEAEEARRIYSQIQSSRPGTIFDIDGMRLAREQLLPPQEPTRTEYSFGPEWRIGALDVNGQRVTLAKKSSNFLDITVATAQASCPYLLSWNPKTETWTEYGKVLHVAKSKGTEQAHSTHISGFRSKFRLAEREPEVAYIDHAELTAELKDGRSLTLTASEPRLANRESQYVVLRMGEFVDFEFKLPDGVNESDVTKSKLTVFGYYEPIASLAHD